MDDLKTLHDAWGAPEAPSPWAYAQARTALLERAARRRFRLPRLGVRLAAAAALALAIAAGVTAVENLGGTNGDGRPALSVPGFAVPAANAAQALERAAVAAEAKPFVAPRDDQWIYFEDRFGDSAVGEATIQRTWRRADGGGFAWLDEHGKLRVSEDEFPKRRHRLRPLEGYAAVAAMPTDPAALLRWAYRQTPYTEGCGRNEDSEVYCIFNGPLRSGVLPPKLEAGIFRALKQVPGVSLDTVHVFGRTVLTLGMTTSDWLHEEILLDPQTYAYRGERSTVIRDATIDPAKAGNATGEVRKGSQVIAERMVAAVVDEPGERPR